MPFDLGLSGRVALVTGGSRGIGAALVKALAAEGCPVAFNHMGDGEAAAEIAAGVRRAGGRALVRESDVADPLATESMFQAAETELGKVDVVICNAGITRDGVVWKMDDAQWTRVIEVNLRGCFNYVRAAARRFRDRAKAGEPLAGRLINIASINGLRGKFGQVNYSASKGGIIALTKAAARELGRFGVTVNAVAPGMVLTPMARALPEAILAKAREETVVGRLAAPEDVADVVLFLASARARHLTGQCLRVDGGQYI